MKLDSEKVAVHPKYSDVIVVKNPDEGFVCGRFTKILLDEMVRCYNVVHNKPQNNKTKEKLIGLPFKIKKENDEFRARHTIESVKEKKD